MRFLEKTKRLIPGALVAACLLSAASGAMASQILFDSGGFEPGAGYTSGALGGGVNLTGQPSAAPSSGQWVQFTNGSLPTFINATVYGYQPYPNTGNENYVQVQGLNMGVGNVGYFYPQTFTSPQSAYVPTAGEQLAVTFTMNTGAPVSSPAPSGDMFFGITLRDSQNRTFGYAGINSSTHAPVGLGTVNNNFDGTNAAFAAPNGTYFNYEVLIDYDTQQYQLLAVSGGVYKLVGSSSFIDVDGNPLTKTTNFGSAPLATFITPGSISTSGSATSIFDNYQVLSSIPEPAVLGSLGMALILLGRRRGVKTPV